MMNRIFLTLVALIFIGYGVACAIDPDLPARLAGLQILSGDGYAEMGAMYGGLQTGVGLFCLFAAVRREHERSALLLLVLGIGFLAALRGASALRAEDVISAYTWGALAFETFVTAASAGLLLRRN